MRTCGQQWSVLAFTFAQLLSDGPHDDTMFTSESVYLVLSIYVRFFCQLLQRRNEPKSNIMFRFKIPLLSCWLNFHSNHFFPSLCYSPVIFSFYFFFTIVDGRRRERKLMCSAFGFGMEWRRGKDREEGGFSLSLLCSRVYCILYAVKREGRETRGSCWPLAIFCKQAKAAGGARQLAGWLVGWLAKRALFFQREREREKSPPENSRKGEQSKAKTGEEEREYPLDDYTKFYDNVDFSSFPITATRVKSRLVYCVQKRWRWSESFRGTRVIGSAHRRRTSKAKASAR